jgi:hypothetical protein
VASASVVPSADLPVVTILTESAAKCGAAQHHHYSPIYLSSLFDECGISPSKHAALAIFPFLFLNKHNSLVHGYVNTKNNIQNRSHFSESISQKWELCSGI